MKRQIPARSPECDSPDTEQCVPDKQRRAEIAVHPTEDSDDAEDCTDSAYVSCETVIEMSPTDELDGCMGSGHCHMFQNFKFSNKSVSDCWNRYNLNDWIFDGDVSNKSVIQFKEPVRSANRLFHKKCQKCVAISQGRVTLKPMQEADVINVFIYRGKEDNGYNAGKDVFVFAFTDSEDQYLCVQGSDSIHVQNRPRAVDTSRQAVPTQTDSRYFYQTMIRETDYCVFESTERQNCYLAVRSTPSGENEEVSLMEVKEADIHLEPAIQFQMYPA